MIATGLLCLFISLFCHWYQNAMNPDNVLSRGLDEYNLGKVRGALELGANPDHLSDEGMRPLERAAATQDPDMAQVLLDYGANPNLGSGWGVPLDEATQFYAPENDASKSRYLRLVTILKQHGAVSRQ